MRLQLIMQLPRECLAYRNDGCSCSGDGGGGGDRGRRGEGRASTRPTASTLRRIRSRDRARRDRFQLLQHGIVLHRDLQSHTIVTIHRVNHESHMFTTSVQVI